MAYRLEPDLKDGHGGLRDVQSLWWAQRVLGCTCRAADEADLTRCYDVLLRARVALHLATERPGEVLRLEDQDAAAAQGGWTDADDLMASVAMAGRTVAWLVRRELGSDDPAHGRARRTGRSRRGSCLFDGEIELSDGANPAENQTLVLTAAVAAARIDVRIGRQSLDRLQHDVEGWPGNWPVGAPTELVALLLEGHRAHPGARSARSARALRAPAARVGARPIEAAAQRLPPLHGRSSPVGGRGQRRRAGADRVGRPDLLVMGALLHDIGKGYPGDHTEVGMVDRPPAGSTARVRAARGRHARGDGRAPPAAARRRDASRPHRRGHDRAGRRRRSRRSNGSSCCTR